MNDKDRIRNAFKELRKMGYFARMNFWCCQSCACADIPESYNNKYVFYHHQDNASIDKFGNLHKNGMYLSHGEGGNANEICEVIRKQGLDASWNGDLDTRILVKPALSS